MNSTTKLPINPNVVKECDLCHIKAVHRKRVVILDKQYSICTDCAKIRQNNKLYAEQATIANQKLPTSIHATLWFALDEVDPNTTYATIIGKPVPPAVQEQILTGNTCLSFRDISQQNITSYVLDMDTGYPTLIITVIGGFHNANLFNEPWDIQDLNNNVIFSSVV